MRPGGNIAPRPVPGRLTLPQAREALARAEARVKAELPGDQAVALIVRKRYRTLVSFLEGETDPDSRPRRPRGARSA